MAHDVFISYSSKDKTVADAVCATLESKGIRCWIAPRDVLPSQSWAAAIVDAISASRVFVLVFSDGSNQSSQVIREVGEAVDRGIPIIPLRIEDVEPSHEMRYYIKSIHWLDAMNPPLERHLVKLANLVQVIISVDASEQSALLLMGEPSSTKSDWRAFKFNIPNTILWRETLDGAYAVSGTVDTFAWSEEIVEGNFILKMDVQSDWFGSYGEGMVLVFGNGMGWSRGCLIFNITGIWQAIRAHSIYDPEVAWLSRIENRLNSNEHNSYTMTIEIKNDLANLFVYDQKVISILLPPEINRRGRIALVKYHGSASATYSNIQIKTVHAI